MYYYFIFFLTLFIYTNYYQVLNVNISLIILNLKNLGEHFSSTIYFKGVT